MSTPPAGPAWLDERIAGGEVVLIDGATGTELEARGVPMHATAWSGTAVLDYGEVLREVHEDFIRAGAEVIITNTFAAARHVLEPAGHGDRVAVVNRKAVEIAQAARDRAANGPVAIAGSMSNSFLRTAGSDWLRPETLAATFREQAEVLAEAGVDLIALEMMRSPELARPAIEAAVTTGLPVWVGASCRRSGDGGLVTFDEPARDFAAELSRLTGLGAGLIAVMHSEVADTGPGLDAVRAHWSGPLGAYPNSGHFVMPNWQFVDIISPDNLVAEAKRWVAQGVQVIGGCCGIGPDHIRRLKDELPARLPGAPS